MATVDQVGFANELVDAAGGPRLRPKTLIPGAQCVALDVAERLLARR
jgi:hypothetical protein